MTATRRAAPYLIEAEIWRDEAIAGGATDPLADLPGVKPHQPIDHARAWEIVWQLRREVREQDRALAIAAGVFRRELAAGARYSREDLARVDAEPRSTLEAEGLGRWRLHLEPDDAARMYRVGITLA